jgi:hypothetical protein
MDNPHWKVVFPKESTGIHRYSIWSQLESLWNPLESTEMLYFLWIPVEFHRNPSGTP